MRRIHMNLLRMALLLALASSARASTTWYVNGVNGSDGNNCKSAQTACKTIGHAISLASAGDSVMVASATYKENLTISSSLNIFGASASTTIVDGGTIGTVVTISPPTSNKVTLSGLTIRNGGNETGGPGIFNQGTLSVLNSIISGNSAPTGPTSGGGVLSTGWLMINKSTISGNTASVGGGVACTSGIAFINNSTISSNLAETEGGGVGAGCRITINNSTISRNAAANRFITTNGGGIYHFGGSANLVINNSTISGNTATFGGGIYIPSGSSGLTLQNTIVAKNPSGGDCGGGGTITSNGYNLSSDGTCNFNGNGDLNNVDPILGPLENNGGPTLTMALLPGSPAIDSGNPNGCTDGQGHLLCHDQRGSRRPDGEDTGGCDRGAYERQSD